MYDNTQNIKLIEKLIFVREESFQQALTESTQQLFLSHLKEDIDFLKEKRKYLLEKLPVEKQFAYI